MPEKKKGVLGKAKLALELGGLSDPPTISTFKVSFQPKQQARSRWCARTSKRTEAGKRAEDDGARRCIKSQDGVFAEVKPSEAPRRDEAGHPGAPPRGGEGQSNQTMDAQERKAAYRQRAEKGEAVPVSVELPADLDTPLSAYLKLGGGRARLHPRVVLRRRALRALQPRGRERRPAACGWTATGATLWRGSREERREGQPLDVLRTLWRELAVATLPGEAPFLGGLVGYLGYNCSSWFERHVPDRHPRDTVLPRLGVAGVRGLRHPRLAHPDAQGHRHRAARAARQRRRRR